MHIAICKLHTYIETVANCTSAWILIILTLFRAVSIWMPHKAKLMCTPGKAIFLAVLSFITHALSFLYIPLKWYEWKVVKHRGVLVTLCEVKENLSYTEFNTMQWYIFIAASFLPFSCLLLGNIYIIVKVTCTKFQRQESNINTSMDKQLQRDHAMMVTLILISLLFLITTSPYLIIKLFEFRGAKFLEGKSRLFLAKYKIWRSVAFLFHYVNNVANIFCYWISGTLFRKELKAMLLCKK